MTKLKRFWRDLRTSFFYAPSLIVAVCIVLAVALIVVDSTRIEQWLALWPRLFGGGAAGAPDVVHDCRFDDDRGGDHVFDDLDDPDAGLEPIHLAHPTELHA